MFKPGHFNKHLTQRPLPLSLLITKFHYQPFQTWITRTCLAANNPNHQLVVYVVSGFHDGFCLGFVHLPQPNQPCENSSRVQKHPDIAQALVDEEVAKGHMLGLFNEPPIKGLVYSPIKIVPKPNGKHRLIHDLAHPYDHQTSVNACIPERISTVHYKHIDEIIDMALQMGISITGSHIDIKAAFCNLWVHILMKYIF